MAAEATPTAGRPKFKLRLVSIQPADAAAGHDRGLHRHELGGDEDESGARQKEAVEAILKARGWVFYDYEEPSSSRRKPPGPAWLRKLLGDDLFVNVTRVDFQFRGIDNAGLQNLRRD